MFYLPHRPKFSDFFDLCLHWVSVVRAYTEHHELDFPSLSQTHSFVKSICMYSLIRTLLSRYWTNPKKRYDKIMFCLNTVLCIYPHFWKCHKPTFFELVPHLTLQNRLDPHLATTWEWPPFSLIQEPFIYHFFHSMHVTFWLLKNI